MGARYVRKEMDCPTVKLKDLKVGVIAECDGEIIMKVCSDDYKSGEIAMLVYSGMTEILYYNFTSGLRLNAVRNSAYATMLVTEYTGSIIIKNE